MLNAVWDAATSGDLDAVAQARQTIMAQCRVLGLVETGNTTRARCTRPQTVIVPEGDMRHCRNNGCPDHI